MVSRQLELECVSGQIQGLKIIDPKYKWSDRKHRIEKDGRFQTSEGKLKVLDIQAKDEGLYTCTVKHGGKTDKFQHLIKVYVVPNFSYQVNLQYVAKRCGQSQRMHKIAHTRAALCKVGKCPVKDVRGVCHLISGESNNHEMWISLSVIPDRKLNLPPCNAACTEKLLMKNLNINLALVQKLVKAQPSTNTSIFTLKKNGIKATLIRQCAGGFRREGVICRPCKPGTSSKSNSKACNACPQGTYQPAYTMKGCIPCDKGKSTSETGARSKAACIVAKPFSAEESNEYAAVGIACGGIALIIMGTGCAYLKMYYDIRKDFKKKPKKKENEDEDEDGNETGASQLLLPRRASDGKGWVVSNPTAPAQQNSLNLLPIFQGTQRAEMDRMPQENIYMDPVRQASNPIAKAGVREQDMTDPIYESIHNMHINKPDYTETQEYWDHRHNDPSLTQSIEPHPPPQVLPGLLDIQQRLGPLPATPSSNIQYSTRL